MAHARAHSCGDLILGGNGKSPTRRGYRDVILPPASPTSYVSKQSGSRSSGDFFPAKKNFAMNLGKCSAMDLRGDPSFPPSSLAEADVSPTFVHLAKLKRRRPLRLRSLDGGEQETEETKQWMGSVLASLTGGGALRGRLGAAPLLAAAKLPRTVAVASPPASAGNSNMIGAGLGESPVSMRRQSGCSPSSRPRLSLAAAAAASLASTGLTVKRGSIVGATLIGGSGSSSKTNSRRPSRVATLEEVFREPAASRRRSSSIGLGSGGSPGGIEAVDRPRRSSFQGQVYDLYEELESLPDPTEVMERIRGGSQGFSPTEVSRMKTHVTRLQAENGGEFHKDQLQPLLEQLGYQKIDPEEVEKMAESVTVYSTLEFSEVVEFMEHFARYERGLFRITFDTFDENCSESLDLIELGNLMASLGFTPIRVTIKESLDIVGCLEQGYLSFPDFVHLVTLFRHTEGFNREEVVTLKTIFEEHLPTVKDEEGNKIEVKKLPPRSLQHVLMQFFGPSCSDLVRRYMKHHMPIAPLDEDWDPAPPLSFHELLVWARRVREEDFSRMRELFVKYDFDKSGYLESAEVMTLISDLGYTLFPEHVEDALREAHEDDYDGDSFDEDGPADQRKLDYEGMVNLLVVLRRRDGFTISEAEALLASFRRFDDNNNGSVECLELSDMLRFMGHTTNLIQVKRLMARFDFDESGALDFREFLRLMRIHREEEIEMAREVFADHVLLEPDGKTPTLFLPRGQLVQALDDLGFCKDHDQGHDTIFVNDDQAEQETIEQLVNQDEPLNFKAFVRAVDHVRAQRVTRQRRCAGFCPAEVSRFRTLFRGFDKENRGHVEPWQVGELLADLGFVIITKEEQQRVQSELDLARQAADSVGVRDAKEPGRVSFWVFVQLLRVIYSKDDKRVLDREERAIEQTGFGKTEVDDFREIFTGLGDRDRVFESDDDLEETSGLALHHYKDLEAPCELSKDCVRRALRGFGVSLSAEQRVKLERKIDDFHTHGRVDFADFLRLFRWMLDQNFADIQQKAAAAARTSA